RRRESPPPRTRGAGRIQMLFAVSKAFRTRPFHGHGGRTPPPGAATSATSPAPPIGGATLGWTVDVLKGLQSGSPEFGSGECRAELRTLGGSGVAYDLTSFRYLIRCGWSASAPRRRLRSSSYSR